MELALLALGIVFGVTLGVYQVLMHYHQRVLLPALQLFKYQPAERSNVSPPEPEKPVVRLPRKVLDEPAIEKIYEQVRSKC